MARLVMAGWIFVSIFADQFAFQFAAGAFGVEADFGHIVEREQDGEDGEPGAEAPIADEKERMLAQPGPEQGGADEDEEEQADQIPIHHEAAGPLITNEAFAGLDDEAHVVHSGGTLRDAGRGVESAL